MSRINVYKRSHRFDRLEDDFDHDDGDDDSDYNIEHDLIVPAKRASSLARQDADTISTASTVSFETDQNDLRRRRRDSSTSPPPSQVQSSSQPKYEYLSLEAVLNLYPITDKKYVYIYAVIVFFDKHKGVIAVKDETNNKVDIHIGKDSNFERLPLLPGDIIRIHRLCLLKDLNLRCSVARNVVIFQSFKENTFSPFYISKNPTISDYDRLRVSSLTEFNRKSLFSLDIQNDQNKPYWICDLVFQVLCTLPIKERMVLACWNGKPLQKFPCWNSIGILDITETLSKVKGINHVYTNDYLRKIYQDRKIVFITVFGDHVKVAKKLNPLDFISIYNLVIKLDSFNNGLYSFLLYDRNQRAIIRQMDSKSEIASQLRIQIEDSYLLDGEPPLDYQNFKFDQSASQILSQSQIFDSSDEDIDENELEFASDSNLAAAGQLDIVASTPAATSADVKIIVKNKKKSKRKISFNSDTDLQPNLTMMIEGALNDTSLDQTIDLINQIKCEHLNFSSFEREVIYRHFVATEVTVDTEAICLRSFKELQSYSRLKPTQKFRIAAKFYSFVFYNSLEVFESIDNLRKKLVYVHCTACDYQECFERFIDECSSCYCVEDGELVLLSGDDFSTLLPSTSGNQPQLTHQNTRNHFEKLLCPRCSRQSCFLSADFFIILQDYDNQLFLTSLSGLDSNRFLSCSTDDYCHANSDILRKLPAIFKYFFHITNDHSPCSQKIFWSFCSQYNRDFDENEFRTTDAQLLTNVASCGVNTIDY